MDPVTTAIVAAVSAGAVAGATKVGENVVLDGYSKLKEALGKKFGEKSKVMKAVQELETNPSSAARKAVVDEELTSAKASQDAELLKAAQELLKVIKARPGGKQIIQMAVGDQNIQIAGDGNVVSVNTPRTKR